MTFRRVVRPLVGIVREIDAFRRVAADGRSLARFGCDVVLYRVLACTRLAAENRERSVRVKGGVTLVYRLNRGDIQAIREVWLEEIYRLPFELKGRSVLVDFGAHIGLASVWLAREYGFSYVLAVEPSSENARLARLNVRLNGVRADVIEAAVSSRAGVTRFEDHRQSQLGRVGQRGREIPIVTPASVYNSLPAGADVDLMKIDIEGDEGALLTDNPTWLERVSALLVEFHGEQVDYPGLARGLERAGFRWFPVGSVLPRTTDGFARLDVSTTRSTA